MFFANSANADYFIHIDAKDTYSIYIYGEITTKDALGLTSDLRKFQENEKQQAFVFSLNSNGGDVNSAITIGRAIRNVDGLAMVEEGKHCLSSCVFLLAGGAYRFAGGTIGIHRPYQRIDTDTSATSQKKKYEAARRVVLEFLDEMNIDKQLYDDMLRISPDQMKVLSQTELEKYGLASDDPYVDEANATKAAKRLGISRGQYAERKAQQKTKCGEYPRDLLSNKDKTFAVANCYDMVLKGLK